MSFFKFNQFVVNKQAPKLKFHWEHDTSTFGSWLMSEMTRKITKELENWQEENPEELPFHGLFNKNNEENQTRTVIPFKADPAALGILEKIEKAGSKIDFQNGTVEIPVFRQQGPPGTRAIKLGKYVLDKRSPFTEEEKKWWNHDGNPVDSLKKAKENNNYAIVVSRNPIDIVRMSDHDGWTSCHSPSREYFQCAISDAKGAGAIAYVVNKHDLDQIPDLQESEIFSDPQRGIKGIKPLSRIRLRKFVHKKDGYDLAVPEERTYGKKFPGLEEAVRKWALENQQDKLKGERPKLKDFHLMGGSYQDTLGSKLFNYFFGDDLDSGEADYGGEEEGQGMFDQYEEEVNRIEEEYKDKFTICSFYASVEDADGPYVHFSGDVILTIPEELMLPQKEHKPKETDKWSDHPKYKIEAAIKEWARDNDIYVINEVEVNGNEVRINIYSENGHTPDDFRDFLANELTDIENKKEKLEHGIYNLFVELGLAKPNRIYQMNQDYDHHADQLIHFNLEGDDPELSITLKQPIKFPLPKKTSSGFQLEYSHWQEVFKKTLMQKLNAWADAVVTNKRKQQSLFQGTEFEHQPQRPFSSEFKIDPKFRIGLNSQFTYFELTIEFKAMEKDEHVDDAMAFIHFLDKNYDKFVELVVQNYKEWSSQWKPNEAPIAQRKMSPMYPYVNPMSQDDFEKETLTQPQRDYLAKQRMQGNNEV